MAEAGSRKGCGTCYRLHGDPATQPVLVFIHGVGLDQSMWTPWRKLLGNRYCILTYDLLGHGESENPSGDRTLKDFADQLAVLLEELSPRQWHLVGFSLGALIALFYCAYRNKNGRGYQRPASLTLLHSVYGRTDAQLAAIEQRYLLTRDSGAMATVEVAIKRWFSEQWISSEETYLEALRETFRRHEDDGYLKAYRLFCDADEELNALDLDRIELPSLVITGDLDTGSTPAMSTRLAARLDGNLIINEQHRHMAPVEHAALVSGQVKRFVDAMDS